MRNKNDQVGQLMGTPNEYLGKFQYRPRIWAVKNISTLGVSKLE